MGFVWDLALTRSSLCIITFALSNSSVIIYFSTLSKASVSVVTSFKLYERVSSVDVKAC